MENRHFLPKRTDPWFPLREPTMGRDDPLVPLANGRILARLIRNAGHEIIDDGHFFW